MDLALIGLLATPILKYVVAGGIAFVVPYICYYVKKQTGIDIAYALDSTNTEKIRNNVLAVEEMAKADADKGNKWTSKQKLDTAMQGAMDTVQDMSVAEVGTQIHAILADTPNVGATGNFTISSDIPEYARGPA